MNGWARFIQRTLNAWARRSGPCTSRPTLPSTVTMTSSRVLCSSVIISGFLCQALRRYLCALHDIISQETIVVPAWSALFIIFSCLHFKTFSFCFNKNKINCDVTTTIFILRNCFAN